MLRSFKQFLKDKFIYRRRFKLEMRANFQDYYLNSFLYKTQLFILFLIFLGLSYLAFSGILNSLQQPNLGGARFKNQALVGASIFCLLFLYLALKYLKGSLFGVRVRVNNLGIYMGKILYEWKNFKSFDINNNCLILHYKSLDKRSFDETRLAVYELISNRLFITDIEGRLQKRKFKSIRPLNKFNPFFSRLIYPIL